MSAVQFHSRSVVIGATRPPISVVGRDSALIAGVMVHHTASPVHVGTNAHSYAKSLYDWCVRPTSQGGRGYGDIEYHAMITQDGQILDCRPSSARGAHCRAPLPGFAHSANTTHLGVAFIMNASQTIPSYLALEALHVYRYLAHLYTGRPLALAWHSQANPTACPGTRLAPILASLPSKV